MVQATPAFPWRCSGSGGRLFLLPEQTTSPFSQSNAAGRYQSGNRQVTRYIKPLRLGIKVST